MSLFDQLHAEELRRGSTWRPKPLPSLDGIPEIIVDFETAGPGKDGGLKWWAGGRPIGFGICFPDGTTQYHPYRHKGDPANHDEEAVKRWWHHEVRGKKITNLNSRFDNHMAYADGVDLEAQGCQWYDVGHDAALLDDHRKKFSLASLCEDFLPDERKILAVNGHELDPTRMDEYPAEMIAVRAEADVRQVFKLKQLFYPQLVEQDLLRVRELESEVIYPVCEMERNASPLDMDKLRAWAQQSEQDMLRCLWQIYRETGLRVNPDSPADMKKLFSALGIPIENFTDTGRASFTGEVLDAIDNPTIKLARRAGKLADLRSKHIIKYLQSKDIELDGLLRYAFWQLRAQKADYRSGEAGTVSGRFSCTDIIDGIGANVQQVLAVEKNLDKYGPEYIIRELFIPGSGLYLAADAKQIEYRIFASKAGTPKVIKAYEENPELSFHHFIWELLKPFKPDLLYKPLKNLNFAYIYGAGIAKIALMMGFINERQYDALKHEYRFKGRNSQGIGMWTDPLLEEAVQVKQIYDRELPEASQLIKRAKDLAENRGYVRTITGRRMRFPNKQRTHKALNGIIQGSGADIMKRKLVELHRERKYTQFTLRITNHDEVTGDVPDQEHAKRVEEILNAQSFPELKVPIRWDVNTGANWKECA